jgi:hypothetical protein
MIEINTNDCITLALLADMNDWHAMRLAKKLSPQAQEVARGMRGCIGVSEAARETAHGILKWARENKK